ncbi:WD40-repeat-containing domain protein [Mycotypha africana]|uniref:WD40-repeat-containing domain protein n=1 Tax=Mycotypha africana TaxID=64632 RepID=UPI002300FD1B|nr:WD40-repeat-containing domain protein [Mycotypha africana]KAI8977283.1 WD40-repeat-containing domain protein [Mycotypha africana]
MPVNIDFLSELKRHSSPVNVVRFSPKGDLLASAGDDACIIIWKLSPIKEKSFGVGDNDDYEKESWTVANMFYGHNKEIYDLAWSPCGNYFITASIDNTARVWSLTERTCIHVFADHTHYVQGVAWDPLGQYVATQSSDRTMALYRYKRNQNGKITFNTHCSKRYTKIQKGKITTSSNTTATVGSITNDNHTAPTTTPATFSYRIFHDENLVSFFRRLSFSPDGALLITPAGLNKVKDTSTAGSESNKNTDNLSEGDELEEGFANCAYIFARNILLKHPLGLIGNYSKPSIAVRWCPQLFSKREAASMLALPYRMLYAAATQDSVYIYDTQQLRPICMMSGMHFASITDISWSCDGSMLMFSSADGYCSAAVFSENELGVKYEKPLSTLLEHDIEMMEVAQPIVPKTAVPHQISAASAQPQQLQLPFKRKPVMAETTPPTASNNSSDAGQGQQQQQNNSINAAKPKKRRIAPILISAPLQSTPSLPSHTLNK